MSTSKLIPKLNFSKTRSKPNLILKRNFSKTMLKPNLLPKPLKTIPSVEKMGVCFGLSFPVTLNSYENYYYYYESVQMEPNGPVQVDLVPFVHSQT